MRNFCSLLCLILARTHKNQHTDRFRAAGRCAIFGFVFIGQKNHKMHISHAHTDRFMLSKRRFLEGRTKRCLCDFEEILSVHSPNRVLTSFKGASKTHTQRLVQSSKIFVWGAYDSEQLVDVRYSVLLLLARKITRCISHTPTEPDRLVDVRYSGLHFLARKITRCLSHAHQPSATSPRFFDNLHFERCGEQKSRTFAPRTK